MDLTQLRIPGVLQRIGFTYFVCSVLEILFIPRLTAVENFVSFTLNLIVSLRLRDNCPLGNELCIQESSSRLDIIVIAFTCRDFNFHDQNSDLLNMNLGVCRAYSIYCIFIPDVI